MSHYLAGGVNGVTLCSETSYDLSTEPESTNKCVEVERLYALTHTNANGRICLDHVSPTIITILESNAFSTCALEIKGSFMR